MTWGNVPIEHRASKYRAGAEAAGDPAVDRVENRNCWGGISLGRIPDRLKHACKPLTSRYVNQTDEC